MESVKLIECPRDAWQGLANHIPTETKVEYLRALIAAGFRHIDAVSFVSPKAVPQMADSEQVLAQLGRADGVEIIGIVVNEKGAQRAIATGAVTTLGFPYSISETFLRRNQNQSSEENREVLKAVAERAKGAGLSVVAYISMAFGNPYGDPWSEEAVAEAVRILDGIGVDSISLADTVGSAEPEMIRAVVTAVSELVGCEIGVHMHSTQAGAASKVLAAYDAGCRRFDAAVGGLGGCPFAQDDLIGNIPTEEVLSALQQRGVELPVRAALTPVMQLNRGIAAEFAR
ncbi:MAG TPA: hydroxymethylglutaryl-CoA lyase [Chthoniobacterales bacterium]|nr:hydroxymethylglutaryl-CoA lyase [Chthoniobacterales bacterium]